MGACRGGGSGGTAGRVVEARQRRHPGIFEVGVSPYHDSLGAAAPREGALTVDALTHGNALTVDDAHGGFI